MGNQSKLKKMVKKSRTEQSFTVQKATFMIAGGVLAYFTKQVPMEPRASWKLKRLFQLYVPLEQKFMAEHKALLDAYVEKDEKGNMLKEPDGRNYKIKEGQREEFDKEFSTLIAETVVIKMPRPKIDVRDIHADVTGEQFGILEALIDFVDGDEA